MTAIQQSDQGTDTGAINSPDIKRGQPTQRAIETVEQANELVRTFKAANRDRNIRNARIMAKYNDERPHRKEELEAEGLKWKANFSTHPLSMLIDRVAPRFVNAIESSRYLTASKLPETVPNAAAKTDAFRSEVTSTIRARPEWKNFLSDLSQENALFGYTNAGYTEEFTYFPTHFRQDQFFIPVGTKQNSKSAQAIVLTEHLLIHEAFRFIDDQEAAKSAGWDLGNMTDEINEAMPDSVRSKFSDQARVYEDLLREAATLSASFSTGAKEVVLNHLLVVEADGKVSHWIVSERSHKLLFKRYDQFDSMEDCSVFFSLQQGNGTMHGSKGIGRQVYEMAGILDRARNEAVDRLQLSGKLVVQGDDKHIRRFKASVLGPALLIDNAFTISERRIEGDAGSFFQLDQYIVRLLDQIAGNTSAASLPGLNQGNGGEALRSKAAWELLASREEEGRDQVLTRFLMQFSNLISVMQRRMCSSRCSEKDAKAMRERLLKVMSEEELTQISEQPSVEIVKDYTDQERQLIILAASEGRGNPLYNQKELERQKLTAQVNSNFAEAVLLPDPDPVETAEQIRLQKMELLFIATSGQPIEVSARDNHRVHLDVLKGAIEQALPEVAEAPDQVKTIRSLIQHGRQHVQFGSQLTKDGFAADATYLAEIEARLRALEAHEQAANDAFIAGQDPVQAGVSAAATAMPQQPAL